jgi:hypothetical protein
MTAIVPGRTIRRRDETLCRRGLGIALAFAILPSLAWAQGASQPAGGNQAPRQPAYIPPAGQQPYTPAGQQPAGQASNPVCVRLESQLAAINQGAPDPARADQIKRTEDAIAKQQADLDRAVAQAHKAGCAGEGFFSLFSALSPQCGPITSQIQQMRGNLDRSMSDLQQLQSGSSMSQDSQRRALVVQLAQNNCGPQYASAASGSGPQNFFDALFGGTIVNSGDGAPAGTYRTVCVRSCDGYYFPISYSTVPSRFADDEKACQRACPASEVALYSYRNPGEDMEQAVSTVGQPYTALPNAFRYRKEFTAACSCRKPGQSWADALKNADDDSTLESGDIVVTDQNAKALSQAPKPAAGKAGSTSVQNAAGAGSNGATGGRDAKRTVRMVGPPFMSAASPGTAAPSSGSH